MSKEKIDEREFELINVIGKELGSNQRDLSRKMELSLGMINLLIRRLVSKGYIRVEQLNKRKVQYILTPKGFAEKMRQSVKYTINTINSIGYIKRRIKSIINGLYKDGERTFYLFCEPDLGLIIERAFQEDQLKGISLKVLTEEPTEKLNGVLLFGWEKRDGGVLDKPGYVDLIKELAKTEELSVSQEKYEA